MSREQNFEAQQRVDQPDAQNLSSGPLQELRRAFRQAVSDEDAAGRVIKGFLVEQEAVPSARIKVVMDLGGGVFSAFLGAENLGGGNIDFGQIVGGHDVAGNLEGSAQNLLDFTGQPPGLFTVKIKFSFVDGIQDNRAFWNEAANSEFVKPTQTRRLPQWQIAFTGHAGAEWITLADVTWDGASIANADITDKRNFAIEGTPRATTILANKWSHPTQDTGGFGVGEFDRTVDRGAPAIGVFGIWKAIRAVARMVQDLKGGRESDLRFDWHSRVFAPPGELGVTPASEKTKTLRTVDVVTFTCADGLTEQGDFNGLSAIHDCFAFIEANPTKLPDRIRIIVKNRDTVSGSPSFSWPTQITITSKSIELYCIGNGAALETSPLPAFDRNPAVTLITPTMGPGLTMLRLRTQANLHMENVRVLPPPAADNTLFDCDRSCGFSAKNSTWATANFDPAVAGLALKCGNERLHIDNCDIAGVLFIGGRDPESLPLTFFDQGTENEFHNTPNGLIERTVVSGAIRLRHENGGGASIDDRWLFANGIDFKKCVLTAVDEANDSAAAFGKAELTIPHADGQIDCTGARNITFESCYLHYSGDMDCIRIAPFTLDAGIFQRPKGITIKNCDFMMRRAAQHTGFVTGAGGVSATEGTGWAIKAIAALVPTDIKQMPDGIRIEGNEFLIGEGDLGFSVLMNSSPDAGAVSLFDCRNVWLDKNKFVNWTQPVDAQGSDSQRIVFIAGTVAGFVLGGNQNIWFTNNFIGDWRDPDGAGTWGAGCTLICLDVTLGNGVKVHGNVISAISNDGTTLNDPSVIAAALQINTSIGVDVHDNRFIDWRSTTTPTNDTCVGLLGICSDIGFKDNHFIRCGGDNIIASAGSTLSNMKFHSNHFDVGTNLALFQSCINLAAATASLIHVRDNEWNYTGAAKAAVHVGDPAVFTTFGNHFRDGNIIHGSLAGATDALALGYGDATLNVVAAYT